MLNDLWLRVRALFRRKAVEAELDDELRFHLESQIEKYVQSGMTPEEARRRAQIELGGLEQVKEECRDARGIRFLETLWQDAHYGLRQLRRNSRFTAVAILTLALGIGLNSTIFSLLDGLFLREPPVRNPEAVVVASLANPSNGATGIPPTPAEFAAWRENAHALAEIAAADRVSRVLTGFGEPRRIVVELVTPSYFRAVGVSPLRGRGFAATQTASQQSHEVVISHGLWRQEFGADPNVLGKAVALSGQTYTVIGVMPADINNALGPCDAWVPANLAASSMNPQERERRQLQVVGRLKEGVPIKSAQAELAVAEQRIAERNPGDNGLIPRVESLREFRTGSNQRAFMPILMALTSIVLLVACANLAGIFLAKCTARRGEFAIRAALGAGRWRTVRQLMVEALLLVLAGAGVALLSSVWGARVLRSGFGAGRSEAWVLSGVHVDYRVLLFTFGISVAAVFLLGLWPAILSSRIDLTSGLKESSQAALFEARRHRARDVFVVVQVALALFLTVAAGTVAREIFQQRIGPRGFDPRGVLAADVSLSSEKYGSAREQAAFFGSALREIWGLPGVQSVALTQALPVSRIPGIFFEVEGRPTLRAQLRPRAGGYIISPDYFRVMRIPFLRGRDFSSADRPGVPDVAIVSEVLARDYFPDSDPLGKHLLLFFPGAEDTPETVRIVGVAANIAENPLRQRGMQVYLPFLQQPRGRMEIVLRASGDPGRLAPAIRHSIWAIDKDQPAGSIRTMRQVISQETGGDTFLGELLAGMTALALVLATLGTYAVVANMVAERGHEIGLRMALGAQRAHIFRMVVAKGMLPAVIGVAIGLLMAAPVPRYVAVSSSLNKNTLLLVAPLVMLASALLACYIPARRAMRVDPMTALRHE